MAEDLTGMGVASLEARKRRCEKILAGIASENNVTKEKIADAERDRLLWQSNLDAVNVRLTQQSK